MASKRTTRNVGITAAVTAVLASVISVFVASPKPGLHEMADTMKIRYQVTPYSSSKWGHTHKLDGEIRAAKSMLAKHQGGSYKIKVLSGDYGKLHSLDKTVARLRDLVKGGTRGQVWVVEAGKDGWKLKARKVDLNPAVYTATEGTHAIDVVVGTIKRWDPEIRIGGIYECRDILGTSTLSQHAYGNAVDVFGTTKAMDNLAHKFYNWAKAGYLPISEILWNYHNLFTGHYVYDHTNHVHFSGAPLQSGGCRRPG